MTDNMTEENSMAAAVAHHRAGRLAEAEEIYRDLIAADPENASLYSNLGAVLRALGRLDEAVDCYREALAIDPDNAVVNGNLGIVLQVQGRLGQAVDHFRRARDMEPDNAAAHLNLGLALQLQGHLGEAVQAYRDALAVEPEFAVAHGNLGSALLELDQIEDAVASVERALALDPDQVNAHTNLGLALQAQGRMDEALASFRRALALDPAHGESHWKYSLALLLSGQFAEGWAEYEWRPGRKAAFSPEFDFDSALWDGSDLQGQEILLYDEQGLGDAIQFIRFARMVSARGGRVVLQCKPQLVRLFGSAAGIDQFAGADGEKIGFDVLAPLGSLPHLLKIDAGTIPADGPYLAAEEDIVSAWESRLGGGRDGFRVGIAWQGSTTYALDRGRSVPLGCFEPLSKIPGVRLISLQKHDGLDQLGDLPPDMIVETLGGDFEAGSDAFIDTAAVMMNLELVITSDTAVAHLAGALGRPVWVALRSSPDWRWMLDRGDSPWYQTMRLFRQGTPGEWEGVFADIAVALGERAEG